MVDWLTLVSERGYFLSSEDVPRVVALWPMCPLLVRWHGDGSAACLDGRDLVPAAEVAARVAQIERGAGYVRDVSMCAWQWRNLDRLARLDVRLTGAGL